MNLKDWEKFRKFSRSHSVFVCFVLLQGSGGLQCEEEEEVRGQGASERHENGGEGAEATEATPEEQQDEPADAAGAAQQ